MVTLYHYTDYMAFEGIMNMGILRLNNILNMNDASEMKFFIEQICNYVYQRLKNEGKNTAARHFGTYIHNEIEEEFHYSAYAACFSRYRDDAAQWERYGRGGQGVCIGFDEAKLMSLMGGSVSLQGVFYDISPKDHPLSEKLYSIFAEERVDVDELENVMDEMWVCSAAFKHPSFISESEVRMMVSPFIADEFAVPPKYHITQNRVKKYYPLYLSAMCERNGMEIQDLVNEIIIGPISTQSKPIFLDYLKDSGLGKLTGKVVVSQCPLRKNVL